MKTIRVNTAPSLPKQFRDRLSRYIGINAGDVNYFRPVKKRTNLKTFITALCKSPFPIRRDTVGDLGAITFRRFRRSIIVALFKTPPSGGWGAYPSGDLGAVTFFGLGQYWFNRFWFIQSWFIQSCLYQSCFGNQ